MLDVCSVCDDLVDVDHRTLPGFDLSLPVLCAGDKCRHGDKPHRCWACEKRVTEVREGLFGTLDTPRMACPPCIAREAAAAEAMEIGGHPV